MEPKDGARIVHDWAVKEGLMIGGAITPTHSTDAELGLVAPVDDVVREILRKKGITGITFNAVANRVTILTRNAKPNAKQLKILPSTLDGLEIAYRQGVVTTIGGEPPLAFGSLPFTIKTVGGQDRYACGGSISQGNCREAGTMGCLVRDVQGTLYGLSNNHISGGCSYALKKLPILAPGVIDVAPNGCDPFTIGYHERALDMSLGVPDNADPTSNWDAALFSIRAEGQVSSFQGDAYDTPASAIDLAVQQEVEKVGRTTGHTKGIVTAQVYGAVPIAYEIDAHAFKGVVYFEPVFAVVGKSSLFSDHGDSGSLVTTVDGQGQRHGVGIIVAGMKDAAAPGGYTSLILPLRPILDEFEVTLVSGHNV